VLASRTGLWLGLFSYSIYLVHDPVVGLLSRYAVGPLNLPPLVTFAVFLCVGLPIVLAVCYGFHLLFEAPFLRRRDMDALRALPMFAPRSWQPAMRARSLAEIARIRLPAWATSRRVRE
jgi:peptidoglycan/LPS O-acetylase OafA/YrhL